MSQAVANTNQEWLKILGKGMVTLPKKWREELGFKEGDIIKAKKEGNRVVIEPQKTSSVPYRLYNDAEIEAFLREDKIPQVLIKKIREKFPQ